MRTNHHKPVGNAVSVDSSFLHLLKGSVDSGFHLHMFLIAFQPSSSSKKQKGKNLKSLPGSLCVAADLATLMVQSSLRERADNADDLVEQIGNCLERGNTIEQSGDCTKQISDKVSGTCFGNNLQNDLIEMHD